MYLIHFIILLLLVLFILFVPVPYAQANGLPQAKSGQWISAIVTAYSPKETCPQGKSENCINASNSRPISGLSVACPRRLKKTQRVIIQGHTYRCDDRTASRYDGRLDIYVESYAEAINFGKQKLTIFLYDEPSK